MGWVRFGPELSDLAAQLNVTPAILDFVVGADSLAQPQ
jgi:hypothetical protein